MALDLSAVITIGATLLYPNKVSHNTLTITNAGTSAHTITSAYAYATLTGTTTIGAQSPAAFSVMPFGPNMTASVAGSGGTLSVGFDSIFFAPSTSVNGATTYTVGAWINSNDGESVQATTATIQVIAIPLPANEL